LVQGLEFKREGVGRGYGVWWCNRARGLKKRSYSIITTRSTLTAIKLIKQVKQQKGFVNYN
jgi:hypothetical protein